MTRREEVPQAYEASHEPPHNDQVEQHLLGALMHSAEVIGAVPSLRPSHFFSHDHARIFAVLRSVVESGAEPTPFAIFDRLKQLGTENDCGGLECLGQLHGCNLGVPTQAGVAGLASIVQEHATRRQALAAVDEARSSLYGGAAVAESLARAQQIISDTATAAGFTAPPKPHTLDLRKMAAEKAPPRRWFVRDWLGPGPMLFAAAGGVGKSLLQQHAATALAVGRRYIGEVDQPYRSLVWGCEDDGDEMWRRQEAISEHLGIALDDPADNLVLQSRRGVENLLMSPNYGELRLTRVFEELRQQANDLHVDILWLDNVAHLFGGDEVNRAHVTAFINAMAGLVTGRPFAVVLLAHTARQAGSEFAGSAAWENACRMRWYLGTKLPDQKADEGATENTSLRYLAKRKSNYSARDYVRFTMRGGVLVPDDLGSEPSGGVSSQLDEMRAEQIVMAGFNALKTMGINTTDGATSPDYLPKQMLAKGLGEAYSKHELDRAMNRLMRRGKLTRGVVGTYSNRTPKQGLVVVSEEPA